MNEASPDQVRHELSAAFERDGWINVHTHPIKITTANGQIILSGKVENIAAKRRALVLARQIAADRWSIIDTLRRVPVETKGDLELRNDVIHRLSSESVFRDYTLRTQVGEKIETVHDAGPAAHEVRVRVDNGAVELSGSAGSLTHKRFAEVLTWWAYGCETVDNRLEVMPPEEDCDDEINDAVLIVLEKDPTVHADQLRIRTVDRVVQMDGYVGSDMERKYAVLDAWAVAGVDNVIDRIAVRP